jgi:hypothetical protein
MTDDWTRRQLLRRTATVAAGLTGAAGLGIGLAGCGSPHSARLAARSASERAAADEVRHFVSRPDLQPPRVTITQADSAVADPAYIFATMPASGPGQGGDMIVDRTGELVWFLRDFASNSRFNFRPQMYQGQRVLTWWEGKVTDGYGLGAGVIADSSYRVTHTVRLVGGLQADLHEFLLTPQGTALLTAYRTSIGDLSSVGGPKQAYLLSGVVQEIDVATGKLLFEWDSLDHVALTESYLPYTPATKANPYNYFHINSIAVAPDGDLLISARNTWAVYKVARPSGQIAWRLNGKKSDFTMGPGAHFYWQHHARPHGATTLSLFDDGANPAKEKCSRALLLDLDATTMTATLTRAFTHPGKVLLAEAMGSAELLPDGRMFVGWGTEPYFSEFAPDGTLLLDGAVPNNDPSYRVFTASWTGRPTEAPAVAVRAGAGGGATVYASWNGATGLAGWTVLAGQTPGTMTRAGAAPWAGFETALVVTAGGPHFAVEAHDGNGNVLARSATIRLT